MKEITNMKLSTNPHPSNFLGKHHTEETKYKISESLKGKNHPNYGKHLSIETRQKISKAHIGKKISEETRQKISLARKGKTLSEEHKRKLSEAILGKKNFWYGKHHTEKVKQKMSLAHKGKTLSEETRRKIGKSGKGRKHTEKARIKISEATRRNWLNPEIRQKISLAHKGKTLSEEHKRKLSVAHIDWDFYYKHGTTRKQYPYPVEFNKKLKKQIAERDNFICQLCNELLPERFATHHIDYNKDNCNSFNLIFLCRRCNAKINSNRIFWQHYFETLQYERLGLKVCYTKIGGIV